VTESVVVPQKLSLLESKMPSISLTDFTDYVLRVGTQKVTKVIEIYKRPEYDPATDYWRRLRSLISEFHEGNADQLSFAATGAGEKKKTAYEDALKGYRSFLKKNPGSYFKPHKAAWNHHDLEIRINPELGWISAKGKTLIKLYFKKEKLTSSRVQVILALMKKSIGASKYEVAILDVRNGKLYSGPSKNSGLDALLEGEATTFLAVWKSQEDNS
jgi:hypothetical protein